MSHPGGQPWGSPPRLTDAEQVTLAMMQAVLGFTSEAQWLRHPRAQLRHLACLDVAATGWVACEGTVPLAVLLDRAMGALGE